MLRRLSNVVVFFGIGRGGGRDRMVRRFVTPSALLMVHVRRRVVLVWLGGRDGARRAWRRLL